MRKRWAVLAVLGGARAQGILLRDGRVLALSFNS